jgi:hypothetical protein
MIFIDADKPSYDFYYEKGLSLLVPGGLMVLDNMLWYGRVLDPMDEDSLAIDRLNAKIVRDNRVENVLLTVRDGVMLVRKKEREPSNWRKILETKTRDMIKRERRKEISHSNKVRAPSERVSRFRKTAKAQTPKPAIKGRERGERR